MAFETNNFNVARKNALPKNTLTIECNISCGDNVAKILSLSAQPVLGACEVLSGSVSYNAYLDVCAIYLNEQGEIGKVSSTCPFSSKFVDARVENGQRAIISLKTLDVQLLSVNGENVRCECSVQEGCTLVENCEVQSVKSGDETICAKHETISVVNLLGEGESLVTVTSELAVRENVKRIILTESDALIKGVESGENFVTVSGEVVSRIVYLSDSDRFEAGYIYQPFKEEIEVQGATRDAKVEAYASIKRDSVKVTLDQGDKGGKIVLEVPLALSVKVYGQVEAEVIKDVYSTVDQLAITTSSFNMTATNSVSVVEGKVDGSLTLDEDRPRVDKILFACGNGVVVTNAYTKDGEIIIEGIAKTSAIYLNDDENAINSAELEVPFVLSDKFNAEQTDGSLSVDAIVCDVDVVVKKGREILYDAKVKANVNYCADSVSGVISEVLAQEPLPERDYAMQVVFGSVGQDAWEIAKQANVKEEMLLQQNPQVVFPLQEESALVLYFQKTN